MDVLHKPIIVSINRNMKVLTTSSLRSDHITPQVAFLKLQALALLESAVLDIGRSRYSFIVVEKQYELTMQDERIMKVYPDGRVTTLPDDPASFLSVLKQASEDARDICNRDAFPHPLPAGGIGFMGYETARFMDDIFLAPQKDDLHLPDAVFIFGKTFLVFDHYKDELTICAIHDQEDQDAGMLAIGEIEQRLFDVDFRAYRCDDRQYPSTSDLHRDRDQFISSVDRIRESIAKGDLLQGVLSRRIDVRSPIPPFEAYRRLRRENPSPYMFYLSFDSWALFGASPEVMISCSGDTASLKPIAGTRPRGSSKKEDADLEQELVNDEKERSEHLMLIDLARNDLNRVCIPGSVRVLHSFHVQRFSHVMHLVSEVEGSLEKGYDCFDVLSSAFPAGTVSGAPKIKAMELVSREEPVKRGPYAGMVGYIDLQGGMDSCITIRSVIWKDGVFSVQSGAGIVYDSQSIREYEETVHKAQAMCASLGVEIS